MVDDLWTVSQCFTCFMGVLWFRWVFWRWNRETTKSEKTAPPGSQSLTKAYRPVMASVLKKTVPKMGKSKASWNIPPNEGFKGKIKLNGGFLRPSLPKGQSFFFGSSESKYGIWWPGDPQQPCAWLRERWHRSSFPMDFPFLGEVITRDVLQETSSEIQHLKKMTWNSDIFLRQLKHLEASLFTTLFFAVCPTFITVVAGSHSKCRQRGTALGPQRVCGANPAAGPVLVGSGRGSLECCHMFPWGDQLKHKIDESLVVEVLFNVWSVTSVPRIGKPKHRCCNRPCFQEAVRNHGAVDLMQKKDTAGVFPVTKMMTIMVYHQD